MDHANWLTAALLHGGDRVCCRLTMEHFRRVEAAAQACSCSDGGRPGISPLIVSHYSAPVAQRELTNAQYFRSAAPASHDKSPFLRERITLLQPFPLALAEEVAVANLGPLGEGLFLARADKM